MYYLDSYWEYTSTNNLIYLPDQNQAFEDHIIADVTADPTEWVSFTTDDGETSKNFSLFPIAVNMSGPYFDIDG